MSETRIVDESSDEGMLRTAADVIRCVDRWRNSTVAWVADDLLQRIDAKYPGPADVIHHNREEAESDDPCEGAALWINVRDRVRT